MKLEWHNRWMRLVVELFPGQPTAIRHYRVAPARLESSIEHSLRRRIFRRLTRIEQEAR